MNTFGKNLRQARQALGLSQQKLADMTQLSQAAISSYERGERRAARDILRLAEALKVTPQWLDGRSSSNNKNSNANTVTKALPIKEQGDSIPFEFEWPFGSVSPLSYYQLSEAERKIVEDLVQSLVKLHPRG